MSTLCVMQAHIKDMPGALKSVTVYVFKYFLKYIYDFFKYFL
jgi:hypothetical protein